MSVLSDLIAARAAAASRLKAAMDTVGAAGYNPNTNASNSIDHFGEVEKLMRVIERLDKQIKDAQDDEDGPVLNETRGVPM